LLSHQIIKLNINYQNYQTFYYEIKKSKTFAIKTKRNSPHTNNSNLGIKLKLSTKETKQNVDHKCIFVADLMDVNEYLGFGIDGIPRGKSSSVDEVYRAR